MPERADEPSGIGAVIRGLLDGLTGGVSLGRLSRAWPEVMGDPLAAETEPLSLDEAGLVIGASSPAWGAQVRFLAEDIRRRASEALGGAPIGPVRVVVRDRPQNRR